MEIVNKPVKFEKCMECIYFELPESESPCDECLNEFTNDYSYIPVYFKKKEGSSDAKRREHGTV